MGIYNIDPNTELPGPGHNFTMLGVGAPWVLETFTETTQNEGGVTAKQTYCFDANTGFLDRRRAYKTGTATTRDDVVVVFTKDGRGNVNSESYYGGDNGALPLSTNLCAIGLPAHDYRIRHATSFGVRRMSVYQNAANADLTFRILNETIDAGSGLPSVRRDVSGLATSFEYDKLGRVTWIKPAAGHGSWAQFIYTRATNASSLARVDIRLRGNGSKSAPILAQEQIQFDEMGRVYRERRRMPNGTWSARETRYNALGWRTHVSEQQTGSPNRFNRFLNYDPFGRAGKIRPADGSQHDVVLTYNGARTLRRTVKVRTSGNATTIGLSNAQTFEEYDRQGRLRRVAEPAGGINAIYGYDIGSRLASVDLNGNGITQRRRFVYDNRGFLKSERHPELSASNSGGFITYSEYDARGHAHRIANNGVTLRHDFDRAERLTAVRNASGSALMKQFIFATANSGSNRRLGRLWKTIRHNRITNPFPPNPVVDVTVTQELFYAGRDGRVSRRDTTMSTGHTFTQSWSYDPLGNVTMLAYPRCTFTPCSTTSGQPVRNQGFTYTRGLLTAVPGFATSITYHPNETVARVNHTNNTSTIVDPDPNGIRRPLDIRLQTPTGTPALGTHKYDGAGNMVARGAEYYLYDLNNRLTRYNLGAPSHQLYRYDTFGNLDRVTTVTGSTVIRTLAMNRAKNRLSSAVYDGRGNLLQRGADRYTWDILDTLIHHDWPLKTYMYTAEDERLYTATFQTGVPLGERFVLRDLDGKPLRVYETVGGFNGTWSWKKDYIYRDDVPLAAATSEAGTRRTQHFAVDHLNSPRLTTGTTGGILETHHYFGFGEESNNPTSTELLRFAGQERDFNLGGTTDDLDYLHARYYSPNMARFLSIDPTKGSVDTRIPQSWNRYAYVRGNPLKFTDPDGEIPLPVIGGIVGALEGAAFQVAINAITGEPLTKGVLREAAIGGGLGLTGVGLIQVTRNAVRVTRAIKAIQAAKRSQGLVSNIVRRRAAVDFIESVAKGQRKLKSLSVAERAKFADELEIVGKQALAKAQAGVPNARARIQAFIFNRERAKFLRGERAKAPLRARDTAEEFADEIDDFLRALDRIGE